MDFLVNDRERRQDFVDYLSGLELEFGVRVTHWNSQRIGTYRLQFQILFRDGNSFWIGAGLNSVKTEWGKIRLEFNPNKIAAHTCFCRVLAYLGVISKRLHTEIKRYDLAIDIPALRENVFLLAKDNRVYSERRHGREYTQYLGVGQHAGRVKLYNKQVESNLPHPLTRLELTLLPSQQYTEVNWPQVYFLRDLQMAFDEIKVCDTERFILHSILMGTGRLDQLGRRMRAKVDLLLQVYLEPIQITLKEFNKVHDSLYFFQKYPKKEIAGTEADSFLLKEAAENEPAV